MAVKEQGNEVIFLRQVIPGGAEKSFGIHVARLAGLPDRVVLRAESVLHGLEESRETQGTEGTLGNSAVVVDERAVVREERAVYDARAEMWREVLRQIADVDIANMTPVQALNLLNEIQIKIKLGNQVEEM